MAKWKPGGPGRPPASASKRRAAIASGRKRGRPKKNVAAQSLGRRGGSARTPKQTAARRRNASKAGRPAKVCIFCGHKVLGGHRQATRDISCGRHGWTYRQRSLETDDSVLRLAILEEIEALQRLLATLPESRFEAAVLPPQEEPKPEPPEPPQPKPAPEPERRLDPATLDWREPEPENKPPEQVPF